MGGKYNAYDIISRNLLKTFGQFFIKDVEIEITTPATGQILQFESATKIINVTDPSLDPYTSFVLNPTSKKLETYKGTALTENLDFPALYVTIASLITTLADYQTIAASRNVWEIHLNSGGVTGDVATRIAGLVEGTDYPTGWVLSVGSTAESLVVTHGLGRACPELYVTSVDPADSSESKMKGDLAYVGLKGASNRNSFEIDTLAQIARELYVYPIFY